MFLGAYETVKAVGKKRLLSASEGVRPELQTVIGPGELEKEEASQWQDGWVKYQDAIYQYNQEIITFLIMGIDKDGDTKAVPEGTEGGQADALFLAVMNPKDNSIKIIGINRNTMADIEIYNGEGAYISTTKAQIAVQHGFGDGMEKAVSIRRKQWGSSFITFPYTDMPPSI